MLHLVCDYSVSFLGQEDYLLMYTHIYVCLCACVSLHDISSVLSPLHAPVHELPKAQQYGPGDSMSYSSSVIKIDFFIAQGLYFGLMPVTLKCESCVLAKINVIFKEVFA